MHPISLNLTSVFRFSLVVFICRCASTRLPMRFGSAVDAHQQRDRCASANNFAAYKQGKRGVKLKNRMSTKYLHHTSRGGHWLIWIIAHGVRH